MMLTKTWILGLEGFFFFVLTAHEVCLSKFVNLCPKSEGIESIETLGQ